MVGGLSAIGFGNGLLDGVPFDFEATELLLKWVNRIEDSFHGAFEGMMMKLLLKRRFVGHFCGISI